MTRRTLLNKKLGFTLPVRSPRELAHRLARWGTELLVFDDEERPNATFTLVLPSWEPENFKESGRLRMLSVAIDKHESIINDWEYTVLCAQRNAYPQFGKRIRWFDLPRPVQSLANEVYPQYLRPVLGLYAHNEALRLSGNQHGQQTI